MWKSWSWRLESWGCFIAAEKKITLLTWEARQLDSSLNPTTLMCRSTCMLAPQQISERSWWLTPGFLQNTWNGHSELFIYEEHKKRKPWQFCFTIQPLSIMRKKNHRIEQELKQLQKEHNFLANNFDLAPILSSFAFAPLHILTSEDVIWLTCLFYVGVSCKVHMFLLFICLQFKASFKLISN